MNLWFTKTSNGLIPACEEASDWLRRKKVNAQILVEPREMRNGAFFRRWWALVKLGFDYFSDSIPPTEYKGEKVQPDFDRFRRDITILAGFFYPVANINGDVRMEPESLNWGSMTEERFGELYNKTIDVLLSKVFNGSRCKEWTEAELRAVVDQIQEFAA